MSHEQSWTSPEPRLRFGTVHEQPMPEGPWADEPDKIQWLDDETQLDCLIVRNQMGALCGYVGVPPGHPLHGKDYSQCLVPDCDETYCYQDGHAAPERLIEVHGGLTFASACHETEDPAQGICHVPLPGRPADVWWFGFDCAHAGDLSPYDLARAEQVNFTYPFTDPRRRDAYRDVDYVKGEVASMAKQLAALA